MPSQNTPHSSGSDGPFKQGPRDWLCQTAGAAARSEGSAVHAVTSVGATFQWPVRIYWEDTDAGGIVFYANYLKFFERTRTEWLRSMGIEQQRLREITGGMFVVIETSTHHHRPARLDDELIVTATLLEMGRASLIIGQQALLKSEHGETASTSENAFSNASLLCQGRIRIGWVDAASMRPARIPDVIVSRLRTPL